MAMKISVIFIVLQLFSNGPDNTLSIWKQETENWAPLSAMEDEIGKVPESIPENTVAFDLNDDYVAIVLENNSIRIWPFEEDEPGWQPMTYIKDKLPLKAPPGVREFYMIEDVFVTVSKNNSIHVLVADLEKPAWEAYKPEENADVIKLPQGTISSNIFEDTILALHADGTILALFQDLKNFQFIKLSIRAKDEGINMPDKAPEGTVQIVATRKYLFARLKNGKLMVLDLESEKIEWEKPSAIDPGFPDACPEGTAVLKIVDS
ncbi:MAG: hypothetical protein JW969_19445 [Spirochaetales bacterium]|nr:hypothetical protein [Spirochaetales bacterium]